MRWRGTKRRRQVVEAQAGEVAPTRWYRWCGGDGSELGAWEMSGGLRSSRRVMEGQ